MSIISGPPQQAADTSSFDDIQLVSIAFGWLLGLVVLTVLHAGVQTSKAWRRVGRLTAYATMVWADIVACIVFGILCWLCAHGTLREGFAFFLIGTTLRCIIIQLTVQILTNRIAILVPSAQTKRLLKWGPFAVEFVLNIGVYCIWIPAHLSLREPWLTINDVYSRTEKAIYMFLDLGLNLYFCHLVKSRLIDAGIRKYRDLYKFNMTILVLGVALDLLLIGLMSLSNPLVYVQFYPVIFMGKLNIEMYVADEIAKIAQASNIGLQPDQKTEGELRVGSDNNDESLASPSSSFRTDSSGRAFNSAPGSEETSAHPDIPRKPPREHTETRRPPQSCLYHAWISGGSNRDGHLAATAVATTANPSDVDEPEHDIELLHSESGRKSGDNVITKHTSVLVRAESASSSTLMEGERIRGASGPCQV